MNLTEYLETAPWGEAARLARALGCSQSRITEYKRGIRTPSPGRAVEISRLTLGRVSLEELCPRINWAEVRGKRRTVGGR